MAVSLAIWALEQEAKYYRKYFSGGASVQEKPGPYATLVVGGIVQTVAISVTPYHTLYSAGSAANWALDDIAYSKRTGLSRGYHNMAPRTLAFARRGGWRWVATKVGSRFIPVLGWGLLAYDLWSVGKWIGEKTSPV